MQKASYGYDRASNRKWRRDDLAHDLGGTQATRHDNFYHYDGLDQVIGRELGELVGTPPNYTGITGAIQDESWSYDATGNWQKYDNAAESNLQQTRCHNAANEITQVTNPGGVIQPAYDEVGNQTLDIAPGDWDRGFSLKWDAWNRLIEVNDGNTLIQTNAYDGLSRRITSGAGTDITHYYYNDAWRSVEEYTEADPDDPACRYLWGLRSRWDLVKRERSDSGTLDEKRYVLYDAMDPVAICDEDGEVVQRFEYSPFGRTTFLDPVFDPDASGNWTFLFHGEFRDEATGYYNYGYRYYNDTTGRWPSRDPIGERGGLNLYGFVSNHPTYSVDRLGKSIWEETEVGIGGEAALHAGLLGISVGAAHTISGKYTVCSQMTVSYRFGVGVFGGASVGAVVVDGPGAGTEPPTGPGMGRPGESSGTSVGGAKGLVGGMVTVENDDDGNATGNSAGGWTFGFGAYIAKTKTFTCKGCVDITCWNFPIVSQLAHARMLKNCLDQMDQMITGMNFNKNKAAEMFLEAVGDFFNWR
jgi:RHS repeat-associated protein